MDQCMGSYTTNSKNKKWSHTGLSLIMDTTRVNGKTLTSLNKGLDPTKVDSFEWGMELCTDLVTPHIRKRLSNVDSIHRDIVTKMELFLNKNRSTGIRRPAPEPGVNFEGPGEPRLCFFCVEQLPRQESNNMLAKCNVIYSQFSLLLVNTVILI